MDIVNIDLDVKDAPVESTADKLSKKKDFSVEAEAMVNASRDRVKNAPQTLNEVLSDVLELEKKTRLAMDVPSTVSLAELCLELCHSCGSWPVLNEYVVLLSKRRAQLQRVIKNIIVKAFNYIPDTPDKDIRRSLLETLRTVSSGKMFVELERARMTRMLSQMEEEEGNVPQAGEILNEIQVETIGSMEVREKAEILLDQLRLCLVNKDYVRCEVLTSKVSVKTLDQEDYQTLKLKFYELNVAYWKHAKNYMKVCQSYRKVFNTPSVQENESQWKDALSKAVLFCVLSPFDNEVSDIIQRIKSEKKLESIPLYNSIIAQFTTSELISWPLSGDEELKQCSVFTQDEEGGEATERLQMLRKRVTQHNLRVFSRCYERIHTSRLSGMLDLSVPETEDAIAEMVCEKSLYARIDRPSGIITFQPKKKPSEIIDIWSNDISKLLNLVENTCHLIDKETQLSRV